MPDNQARDPLLEDWQRAYRQIQQPGTSGCPEAETLVALALGELHGDDRTVVADHVVGCSRCTPRYQETLTLHDAADPELPGAGKSGTGQTSLWRVAAVAALIVVGIGLSVVLLPVGRTGSPQPVERGPGEPTAAVVPADRQQLEQPPRQLGWQAIEGADSYRVVLYDLESTPIWESDRTSGTDLELPAEVRELILPGQPYYWRVFSLIGVERHQSPLYQFELDP